MGAGPISGARKGQLKGASLPEEPQNLASPQEGPGVELRCRDDRLKPGTQFQL